MNAPWGKVGILPFAVHGGRIAEARARYPQATLPWLDLSTGIAPWPYPIPELPVESWTRLPEPELLQGLIVAARGYYRVQPGAHMVAVPGTDLAIGLIPRLIGGPRRVRIVAPTYASHASAWRAAGHEVEEVLGIADFGDAEIAVVVNPNNPDGTAWKPSELRLIAADLHRRGGLLVVDEAFADVSLENSVLDGESENPGAVVLRSFGKFFGLAGVRLGFVVSSHPVAQVLGQALGAWPVSGAAAALGSKAFTDEAWIAHQRGRLATAADQLTRLLEDTGVATTGTDLFKLITHPGGPHLFRHLADHGILVRPFETGERLRFGLPASDHEFLRLSNALAAWKQP